MKLNKKFTDIRTFWNNIVKISKRVLENERTRLSSKLVSVIEELTEKFEFLL